VPPSRDPALLRGLQGPRAGQVGRGRPLGGTRGGRGGDPAFLPAGQGGGPARRGGPARPGPGRVTRPGQHPRPASVADRTAAPVPQAHPVLRRTRCRSRTATSAHPPFAVAAPQTRRAADRDRQTRPPYGRTLGQYIGTSSTV